MARAPQRRCVGARGGAARRDLGAGARHHPPHTARHAAAGRARGDGGEREPLRLLYALLAARPAGEQAAAQLVVRVHHGTHIHGLGAGLPGGRGALHVAARGGLLLAHAVAVLASGLGRELLDIAATPTTAHPGAHPGRATVRTGRRGRGRAG